MLLLRRSAFWVRLLFALFSASHRCGGNIEDLDMKRFTETNKWNDPWYMGLSPTAKHLWQYLLDHCDNAGVVEPNAKLASFQIGEPVKHEHFTELGDRIQSLPNGKLLIPKFIGFQFGTLSRESRVHGSVLKLLENHGITYPINSLSIPYVKGTGTLKDKEKDKDKEKEGGSGGNHDPLPIPESLKTGEFVAAWGKWMNYRRGLKKPGNWVTLFQEQLKWLAQFNSTKAVTVLSQSMRNGWTGLFEPKEIHGQNNQPRKPEPETIFERDLRKMNEQLERQQL